MEVPCYYEISVNNLYEDAMKDQLLVKFLPTKEQLSGRLPERDFFFGLMCTQRNQYMKVIIAGAQKARFTVAEDYTKKQAISISGAWIAELQKNPYHSSKLLLLILVEKPGNGIFLIKESAKLHRPQKEPEKRSWPSDSCLTAKSATMKEKQVGHRIRDRTLEEDSSQRCSHTSKETHR
jgi:hypothetical protein